MISLSESMAGAYTMFGSFVNFIVEIPEASTDQDVSRMSVLPHAFSVMIAAQTSLEALEKSGLPQLVQQRTQKDKL